VLGRRPVAEAVGPTRGCWVSCTIRALSIPVDAVNRTRQQARVLPQQPRHHRRSAPRSNASTPRRTNSIPATSTVLVCVRAGQATSRPPYRSPRVAAFVCLTIGTRAHPGL